MCPILWSGLYGHTSESHDRAPDLANTRVKHVPNQITDGIGIEDCAWDKRHGCQISGSFGRNKQGVAESCRIALQGFRL
jgi:hypothetical protein